MNRILIAGTAALVLVAGCAAVKQGGGDTRTGISAPLAEGETSPMAEGKRIGDPVKDLPIPFSGPIGSAVGVLAGLYFANRRGARIRKAGGLSTEPVTGWAGKVTGVEQVVQVASNVVRGIFEVGPEGSTVKRAWKAGLATAMASGLLLVPGVNDWVAVHSGSIGELMAALAVVLGAGTAGILGTEKALSVIKPVTEAPVPPTT